MTGQQIDRDQLRELAENATPGPWEADLDRHGETRGIWPTVPGEEQIIGAYIAADGYDSQGWSGGTDENLEFIAAARTAVPQLLDQIDQQEAELDSWMTRAYEAEKRVWQAETRLSGWMEHWNATARTGAVDEVAAILEANARADQAEARIKAVRDLHSPSDEQVIMGDCAAEECDHQEIEDCPTEPFTVCAECYRAAIELNPYYGEQGVDDVAWPCPTIRALDGEQ